MNKESKNQIDPFSPKASLGIPYHENEYFQKQIYPEFLNFLDFNTDQSHATMYDGRGNTRYKNESIGFSEEIQERFWKANFHYYNLLDCIAFPSLGSKVAGISIGPEFRIPENGGIVESVTRKIRVLSEFFNNEPVYSEINLHRTNEFNLYYSMDDKVREMNLKELNERMRKAKFLNFRLRNKRRPMLIPLCPNGFRPVTWRNENYTIVRENEISDYFQHLLNSDN